MPVLNRIADFAADMTAWRRHLHAHPELGFECHETAAFVVARLREFGVDEIHEGIATSGVVAIINGVGPGPTIGLRADMDALAMDEETGLDYASKFAGRMHACGHDGHTTMLLGAARYLAETRNFSGRVALIFQPAEEDGGGGEVMVNEGILDRFDIAEVYALHNDPGMAEGHFRTVTGPMMAAVDRFDIRLNGQGGHVAMPHLARDPVVAAVAIAGAILTISSRNVDPLDDLVVSVQQIHTGSADNIIPETAWLCGTIRSFDESVRAMAQRRLDEITRALAAAYGVEATLEIGSGYPPTVNAPEPTRKACEVAAEIVGAERVDPNSTREMGAEDFAFLSRARPGAYLMLGQGEGPSVHNTFYNFNDEIAPIGASYFARLVERLQPAR